MAIIQFFNSSPVGCSTCTVFITSGGSLVPSACLWMNIGRRNRFGSLARGIMLGNLGTKFEC